MTLAPDGQTGKVSRQNLPTESIRDFGEKNNPEKQSPVEPRKCSPPYDRIAATGDRARLLEQLAPLQATFCPMERAAMLQAALVTVRFYQELAPPLAQAHGIPYPAELARVLSERLEQLGHAGLS